MFWFCVLCSGLGVSVFLRFLFLFFKKVKFSFREMFSYRGFFNCDKWAFYFLDISKLLVWFIQVFYSNLQMISTVSFAQPQYKKWKASQIRINCHSMKLKIWNWSFLPCEWYENSAFLILGDSCVYLQITGKSFQDEIWKIITEKNCLTHA